MLQIITQDIRKTFERCWSFLFLIIILNALNFITFYACSFSMSFADMFFNNELLQRSWYVIIIILLIAFLLIPLAYMVVMLIPFKILENINIGKLFSNTITESVVFVIICAAYAFKLLYRIFLYTNPNIVQSIFYVLIVIFAYSFNAICFFRK